MDDMGWRINEQAIAAKSAGRETEELKILLEGVRTRVDTPYTYERAALLLERMGNLTDALAACDAWFSQPPQVQRRGSTTGAKIAERKARLQTKLAMQHDPPARDPDDHSRTSPP